MYAEGLKVYARDSAQRRDVPVLRSWSVAVDIGPYNHSGGERDPNSRVWSGAPDAACPRLHRDRETVSKLASKSSSRICCQLWCRRPGVARTGTARGGRGQGPCVVGRQAAGNEAARCVLAGALSIWILYEPKRFGLGPRPLVVVGVHRWAKNLGALS